MWSWKSFGLGALAMMAVVMFSAMLINNQPEGAALPQRNGLRVVSYVVTVVPTPLPTALSYMGCEAGWRLPVDAAKYRVTASFGYQSAGSDYFKALNAVGGLAPGAQGVLHPGVDIGVEVGTPVYAVAAGKVMSAAYSGQYGNFILVQDAVNLARQELYGHLSQPLVELGQMVNCHQVIALSGATGAAINGAHLHVELRENGIAVDPQALLASAAQTAQQAKR